MNISGGELVLVRLRNEVIGPILVNRLHEVKGFTPQTFVSFPGSGKWAPAFRILNIRAPHAPLVITPNLTGEASWVVVPQFSQARKALTSRVFEGPIGPATRGWVDRCLRRLVVAHTLIAIAILSAWSYKPMQMAMTDRWHSEISMVQAQIPLSWKTLWVPRATSWWASQRSSWMTAHPVEKLDLMISSLLKTAGRGERPSPFRKSYSSRSPASSLSESLIR